MRLRAHPRTVGVFVMGAIAVLLGGVLALTSGDWLAQRGSFTVFFPGSVRGLNSGAPVTFRGVRIGEVKDVRAVLTGLDDPLVQIEVVLELRSDVVQAPEGVPRPFEGLGPREYADELIRRGIRARMLSASLLTGQRYIELDFMPDEPARFGGLRPRYPELPTTPTALEKLSARAEEFMNKIADLPLEDMLEDVRSALASLPDLVGSEDLRAAFAAADRSMTELEPLLGETRVAVARLEELLATVDREVTATGAQGRDSAAELRRAMGRAADAMTSLERTLQGTRQTQLEATETLREMAQTLAMLRNLVEYIQTHPEAVVLGKAPAQEER